MIAIEEKIQILNETFSTLLTDYVRILRKAGTYLHSCSIEPATEHFHGLDFAAKVAVLQRVQVDLDLLSELLDGDCELTNARILIESYLRKIGKSVSSRVLEKIEVDDVICVYDQEQRQIFQTLRFFDFVTVGLDELFCVSWFDQRHVEPLPHQMICQSLREVLEGRHPQGLAPQVKEYRVHRSDQSARFEFLQQVKWLEPIHQDQRIAGAIAINRFRKCGSAVARIGD